MENIGGPRRAGRAKAIKDSALLAFAPEIYMGGYALHQRMAERSMAIISNALFSFVLGHVVGPSVDVAFECL